MPLPRFNILRSLVVPFALILLVLVSVSCRFSSKNVQENSERTFKLPQWYRQAVVDLGHRIQMFSSQEGIAISRGMGKDVKGKAYRFKNGQWIPFYEYPYSDYPLIVRIDSSNFWTINHLTHDGAYRPVFSEYKNGNRKEISLPKVMWDEIDYAMFKGIHRFEDGTAWMVGQQGHILYFDGKVWQEVESPLIHKDRANVYDGDLNDIVMTSKNTGWAVGRNGIIIRYENGKWKKIESPTDQILQKISMANDSTGWAVGNSGTILECRNYHWQKVQSDIREQLLSVVAIDEHTALAVGNNSTVLYFNGETWNQDESIKNYDDLFSDVSVVRDSAGNKDVWIIGNQGIYTTSQSLGFSFTDITNQAGLRRVGKLGHFFSRSDDEIPDLLVANDGGTSLLYENDGKNHFADVTSETELRESPRDAYVSAIGDVNNDGEQDILEVIDHTNFRFYLGTMSGGFRDFTERSELQFAEINPLVPNAATFVDLNNDGNLDLYFSNFDLPDQIFLGDGSGKFQKVNIDIVLNKILNHSSYGAVFTDVNNDLKIDILIPYYVSSNGKFFSLFLNNGGLKFSEVDDSLFHSTTDLSPTAVTSADFNNDGNIDFYIHSQKVPPMLWMNDGEGKFTDVSRNVGFTTTLVHPEPINGIVATADVNNDGWIDIYDGSKLFLNSPQFIFTEVTERVGIQFVGTPTFSDVDNDGDQDLFIGSSRSSLGKGDRAALFRNNLNQKSFVKVRVSGDASNHSAIGTKIILESPDGTKQTRIIGGGGTQLTMQNLHEVHFGGIQEYSIKVLFPSGIMKERTGILSGEIVTIDEANTVSAIFYSFIKSFGRTVSLMTYERLSVVFISLMLLIVLLLVGGKMIDAKKITHRWFPVMMMIVLYGMVIHLTIYETLLLSGFISFFGTVVVMFFVSVIGKVVIEKREAQYISHFKVLELLGAGGMGKVYKAVDSETKKIVALKVLNPELLKDPENRRRLSAEGHLLASFNHPNIVKVYEIGESNERGFIAMEYLNGGTLREKLEKEHPISIPDIKNYIIQICDGLTEVHEKDIVHRDLKTGNLMLGSDGNLRIMDFGLSKSPLVTTMTSLGTVLGTLGYVAPEQVTSLNVDRRTDIFSLGVIIYELLTKELPFKGENEIALIHSIFNTVPPVPSQLRTDCPKEWDAIVMKCLAKDMNERFSNAEEVKQQLTISNS